jgi:phosphoribosyl 1,2-cyclic phosphodiesterase/CheY-like chemotaxis protein
LIQPLMKTILLIDDDVDFRDALASLLRAHGWEVIESGDGDAALVLARERRPSVILCDLLMPGTNGFRVCSTIRGDHALRYSLLVAMSGRDFDDTRQTAMEAGADEFLAKPIDSGRLLEILQQMTVPPPFARKEFDTSRILRGSAPFLRFWGVRGSVPVPGPSTVRHGGNTSCVELRVAGEIIILDSGTGIRELGDELIREFQEQPLSLSLLITHSHWDHVQGFPFFQPAYEARNQIRVFGFEGAREGLAGIFSGQMESPYFPIGLGQLPSHVVFEELKRMEFSIGRVPVQAAFVNHPGICVGYRLQAVDCSIVFAPDHEPFLRKFNASRPGATAADATEFARREDERFIEFIRGADILILDAQYDEEEYRSHVGWGHCCVDDTVDLAIRGGVRHLFLFHHDPSHGDAKLDGILRHARAFALARGSSLQIDLASEGLKIALPSNSPAQVECESFNREGRSG